MFADNILLSLAKKCEKNVKLFRRNAEAAALLRPSSDLAGKDGEKKKSGKRYRLNLQTERAILKLIAAYRACRRQNARKCSVQTLL
jgi:hypothetical protein